MEREKLEDLLKRVQAGKLDIPGAMAEMKFLPYQDLGFARLDHHRGIRQGTAEVVFGEGKSPKQIIEIIKHLKASDGKVMVTRVDREKAKKIRSVHRELDYYPQARILASPKKEKTGKGGKRKSTSGPSVGNNFVLVICAGTADIPVAEEAAVTAEVLGSRVERLYDVGVAGVHRLLNEKDRLSRARVIVVVAGMEGALASLVGGLVDQPVIAVPTSTGYGANFKGLAPLLSMLNSCAAGLAVVNIDNGFGAGFLAGRIDRLIDASARK
jgi:NCAIR mutase (PurE)-related protein